MRRHGTLRAHLSSIDRFVSAAMSAFHPLRTFEPAVIVAGVAMTHQGLTYARRWATASATVSVFMLLVALASPSTPLWPFLLVNWLIFVPGGLLMMRNAKNERGDPQVLRDAPAQVGRPELVPAAARVA